MTASCKKQACVSHSSTESEIVAAEQAIRTEGLQALAFWELVVELLGTQPQPKKVETPSVVPNTLEMNPYSEKFDPGKYFAYTHKNTAVTNLIIAEDNEAVIKIIKKARSMSLRHLPRTHRIDLNWLFEVCSQPRIRMLYVNTKQQVADLMTKALNNPQTWEHLLDIAQIRGGITAEKGSVVPLLIAAPPGLSMPMSAAQCNVCGFDTTTASQCMCDWT